jgi:Short C-terminal domain
MRRRGRRGPGVLGTVAVVGGTAAVAHHAGAKSAQAQAQEQAQNQQIADLQAQQAAGQQQAAAAPAAPAPPDDAAEIQKYAAMKGQGLITEEEFQAKKKQILGI